MTVLILFKEGENPYLQLEDVFSIEKSNGDIVFKTMNNSYLYSVHRFHADEIIFINVYRVV